ncbi:MAG: acetyl-CoA carboxylase biotin carboxyl carrier protein [Candidatus Marinimicrobia bacterium]|jgi:acetyl-CoA carboxylase biotin carboxyl carrier protein|nr:acetyl-CoA carboxylase biotin carboxyl carrier protein [Candidatus Neomarinimicrobiota bacterium]
MWQDKLKEIIYILEHSDVNEIEVRFWGKTYRVVKAASAKEIAPDESVTSILRSTADSSDESRESEKKENEQSGYKINSPMPGTFYRSSSPDADPFVKEGDQVVKGDTLCIIEAMKIMNEIEAEENGTIEKVLIENGSPVEFDQPLFVLRSE